MAPSVSRFALKTKWCVSNVAGRQALMWCESSLSKHFVTRGVSAIGRQSCRLSVAGFSGSGNDGG